MITITGVHLQSEPVLFQIFWCKPARCHVQCVVWDVVKHGDTLAILWGYTSLSLSGRPIS